MGANRNLRITTHLVLITTFQAAFIGNWNLNYYMNKQYLVSFRAKNYIFSREDNMLKYHVNIKTAPFDAQPLIYYYLFIIDLYTINRILHGRLEIPNFSCWKVFLHEKCSISAQPCNILYLTNFPSHTSSNMNSR